MAEAGNIVPVYFYEGRECEKGGKTYLVHLATTVKMVEGNKDALEARATKQLDKVLAEELQKWNDDVTKEPKLLVDDFKRAKFGSSEDKAEAQYELKMIMSAGFLKAMKEFNKYVILQPNVIMTPPKEITVGPNGNRRVEFAGMVLESVPVRPGERERRPSDMKEHHGGPLDPTKHYLCVRHGDDVITTVFEVPKAKSRKYQNMMTAVLGLGASLRLPVRNCPEYLAHPSEVIIIDGATGKHLGDEPIPPNVMMTFEQGMDVEEDVSSAVGEISL